jgi:hypothetical protein
VKKIYAYDVSFGTDVSARHVLVMDRAKVSENFSASLSLELRSCYTTSVCMKIVSLGKRTISPFGLVHRNRVDLALLPPWSPCNSSPETAICPIASSCVLRLKRVSSTAYQLRVFHAFMNCWNRNIAVDGESKLAVPLVVAIRGNVAGPKQCVAYPSQVRTNTNLSQDYEM